jgi:hypothetical protein
VVLLVIPLRNFQLAHLLKIGLLTNIAVPGKIPSPCGVWGSTGGSDRNHPQISSGGEEASG